jgi:Na+/melibiose symporter-like transporter
MFGLFLAMIQYLQAVLGYSAVRAAVALLPMAAAMMPLSTVAPQIAKRVGLRTMLAGGGLVMAAGLVLLGMFATADNGYLGILPGLVVLGLGVGLAMSPGTEAITGSLPEERQGVASALNDTVREFGGALGVALIGSLLSAGYNARIGTVTADLPAGLAASVRDGIGGAFAVAPQLGDRAPVVLAGARDAFVNGWQLSMWVAAAMLFATAVFSAVWVPGRAEVLDLEGELDRSELALAGVD